MPNLCSGRAGAAANAANDSASSASRAGDAPTTQGEVKYDGRTIEEWVTRFGSNMFDERKEAIEALVRIGEPAVPVMVKYIRENRPASSNMLWVFYQMGPAARGALPLLKEITEYPDHKTLQGWTGGKLSRETAINVMCYLPWAADELTPLLQRFAEDTSQTAAVRTAATRSLGGMGEVAVPLLRRHAGSSDMVVRETARESLGTIHAKSSPQAGIEYWAEVIGNDPFDPHVPGYLDRMRRIADSDRTRAVHEEVKAAYRKRLQAKSDPDLAWRLAGIVNEELKNTRLQWATHLDIYQPTQKRKALHENFHTLAAALKRGFDQAPDGSALRRRFGLSLAKYHLLCGDWKEMNAALERVGYAPIPEKDRPWLAAPPHNWSNDLRAQWQPADKSMRSGDCSVVFRMEKDGKGLQGFHVVVQKRPSEELRKFRNSLSFPMMPTDTLCLNAHPLGESDSFGYRGGREHTRYGVSDASGEVRIDGLPAIPIRYEIMIPTGIFPEAAAAWDLWIKSESEPLQRAAMFGERGGVSPADIELKPGKTVRHPTLGVCPHFDFDIGDWAQVDDNFVLRWSGFQPPPGRKIHYEVQMCLTAPSRRADAGAALPVIAQRSAATDSTRWPIGEKGVGGLRLTPGNMYALQVLARDASGAVFARWGETPVWVPWEHRKSRPPLASLGEGTALPVYHGTRPRGIEAADNWLREHPDAFEHEYVAVGKAWLTWLTGSVPTARNELARLCRDLRKGNAAQATALRLIARIDAGEPAPQNLHYIAFDDLTADERWLLHAGGTIQW